MCGIMGYVGDDPATPIVLDGLRSHCYDLLGGLLAQLLRAQRYGPASQLGHESRAALPVKLVRPPPSALRTQISPLCDSVR